MQFFLARYWPLGEMTEADEFLSCFSLIRKRELKPKLEDKLREEETVLMDLNPQLEAFELDIQLQMKTTMSQLGVQIRKQ
jgi:hypothetical protein